MNGGAKRLALFALSLTLLAIIVCPLALQAPLALIPKDMQKEIANPTNIFVHPGILTGEVFRKPRAPQEFLDAMDKLYQVLKEHGVEPLSLTKGMSRVLIVATPTTNVKSIAKSVRGIISTINTGLYLITYAWIDEESISKLSRIPGIIAILPDERIDIQILAEAKTLAKAKESVTEASGVSKPGKEPEMFVATEIIEATKVWQEYGVFGEDVKIAIVDTGVDYAHPDLGLGVIARDENGVPLILDADTLGLVLTPITTVKNETTKTIQITEPVLIFDPTGYAYKLPVGFVFYYDFYTGNYIYIEYPIDTWYVGNITSATGYYKFGLGLQIYYIYYGIYGLAVFTVPILVTSSDGVTYDTAYADLSTTWYYISYALNATGYVVPMLPAPDFSFADEKPVRYGDEITMLDINGDGLVDFSVGTLAGYVYDSYGVIELYKSGVLEQLVDEYGGVGFIPIWQFWTYDAIGYTYPGLDIEGDYVVLQYDFVGHGTSCAATAAAPAAYSGLMGVAPATKIASAPALWLGNTIVAWLWFSGHDIEPWNITFGNYTWIYTGEHKVDIISNSWGISGWILAGWGNGYDPWSVSADYIIASTDTVLTIAVGNGGPGYGTIVVPGASTLAISVGASTSHFFRYFYGFLPGTYDEVVSWSNRGPTTLGTVKPDLVAIGSFAYTATHLFAGLGDGGRAIDLFGGTSQATPMTAGVAALVISAYKAKYGRSPPADLVKVILKSTADDIGYDPYSQGTGRVNAYKAVKYVLEGKHFIAYGIGIGARVIRLMLGDNYESVMAATLKYYKRLRMMRDTQIYLGTIPQGGSSYDWLVIRGRGTYKLEAKQFKVEEVVADVCNLIDFSKAYGAEYVVNCTNNTLYLYLPAGMPIVTFLPLNETALTDADMLEIESIIPYEYIDPYGRYGYYSPFIEPWLRLHYWVDANNDSFINYRAGETMLMQYDVRLGTAHHVQIGKPSEKFALAREIASYYTGIDPETVYHAPILEFRIFTNVYEENITLPVKLVIRKLKLTDFGPLPKVIVYPERITARYGITIARVRADVLPETPPGCYQGYIIITREEDGAQVFVPVSLQVALSIQPPRISAELTGEESYELMPPLALRGAFDWTWRYESSDWRFIPIYITDPYAVGMVVTVTWPDTASNIDIGVIGPASGVIYDTETGEILYKFRVSGILLGGKLSAYLYRSGWIGYYDIPAPGIAKIFVPIFGKGLYTLIVRNPIFGGHYIAEPFNVKIDIVKMYRPSMIRLRSTDSRRYVSVLLTPASELDGAKLYVHELVVGYTKVHYCSDIGLNISIYDGLLSFRTIGPYYGDVERIRIVTVNTPPDLYTATIMLNTTDVDLPILAYGVIKYGERSDSVYITETPLMTLTIRVTR